MKALRYTLVVGALGALGAAVLLSSGKEPEGPAPEAVAPAVPSKPEPAPAPPAAAKPASAVAALLPPLDPSEEIPGEQGEHGEFTTTTDLVKQKIFKTEPGLARFDYFREHVLLDSTNREAYQALLADKEMHEQTRRALLHPADTQDTMESNTRRLMQIDYLREALSWKENPERQHLVATMESVIFEDSFGPTMPPDVKRSLAATKMELYEILYAQEPERARALVEAARGTRLEKMLEYIAARNERWLAKERELSLQAQRSEMP